MRVHVFQHVPFEDIGSIRDWLREREADIRYTRLYAGDALPALNEIDFLIAMGGPMSVNDEAECPWLIAEKQVLRDAIARGIPVLGVCLGSQLIASALGARVYRNPVKEIGWLPIQRAVGATQSFPFPSEMTVFHWHGETFDLPPGATHLARSDGCKHQAFQIGQHVVGLQFHLEMTADALRSMVAHGRSELAPGQYVQTESELLAAPDSVYEAGHALMNDILGVLGRPAGNSARRSASYRALIAASARDVLAGRCPFFDFVRLAGGYRTGDDDVDTLIDVLVHEPAADGWLGVGKTVHDSYMTEIEQAIRVLEEP